jgi:DNA invertase Pin-like site-specific DNA recombinase
MNKFIAYYRVSTNKQNLGLDAQRNSVLNYIANDEANNLIAEYSEKESGKNNQRKELSNAINHCISTNSTLIISKLDRLSRNISFIFQLRDSGIKFIALDIPTFNTLSLGIYASMAQAERELCSRRTKESLAVKKLTMKLGAPNATFTKEMIESASLMRKQIADENMNNQRAKCMIESLLASTKNCSEIARILNNNGFRTSKDMLFSSKQVKRIIERYNLN